MEDWDVRPKYVQYITFSIITIIDTLKISLSLFIVVSLYYWWIHWTSGLCCGSSINVDYFNWNLPDIYQKWYLLLLTKQFMILFHILLNEHLKATLKLFKSLPIFKVVLLFLYQAVVTLWPVHQAPSQAPATPAATPMVPTVRGISTFPQET